MSRRPSEARWRVKLPDNNKPPLARRLVIHCSTPGPTVSAQGNSEDVISETPVTGMDDDPFPATLVRASGERAGDWGCVQGK